MSVLKLSFLGSPRVELDGAALSFDTRKAVALLAYLALSGPSATREALAALLFPEYEPERAHANLRRTLWTLNKAGLAPWLDASSEQVGLVGSADLWVDVKEFHRLISGADSLQNLETAAGLHRGDFLAGFSLKDSAAFDEWQFFQAETCRQELARVLEHLSRELASQEAFDSAIAHARRWLSLDPLHESAHRWLMRLYATSDRRAAAIRQYQECAQILREEIGAEPEAETQALYAEVRKGPRARQVWEAKRPSIPGEPLASSVPSPPHNLPVPATPFVGRHRELEQIQALLADPTCRLLTLLGPGGIGKTRLAVRAAGEVLRAFPDGVCFIALDSVKTPDLLPAAILQALRSSGVLKQDNQAAAGDQSQLLLRHLRERRALLVVDNFEHLLAAAVLWSEVLAQAPGVKFLVTSRERLGLQEEWVMDIGGLDYPDSLPAATEGQAGEQIAAAMQDYSAVMLFLQGAMRALPDFRLTPAVVPHIARICQLVQGMPLGIDLAAAWLRVLPCQEIAAELQCGLDLLGGSLSNVPERHRSLRAVFDSSWQMLSSEEQETFKGLTIFQGGFSHVAAAQVAGANLAVLSGLQNKSWLRRRNDGRLQVHELLRQFGGEKLDESPREGVVVRDRHSHYYLGWLSKLNADLQGKRQDEALREIRQDLDNVRVAWEWAIERSRWEALDAASESLWIFHFYMSSFAEGERFFRCAAERLAQAENADRAPKPASTAVLGRFLARQGAFSLLAGQFGQAMAKLQQGLDLCREAGDQAEAAFALNWLDNIAYAQGDLAETRRRYEESLAIRQAAA